jgi:hypothetical protein
MSTKTLRAALLAAVTLAVAAAGWFGGRTAVRAQEPETAVRPGRQEVTAEIDDARGLVVVTIRQEFVNTTRHPAEGSLDLPLPNDAAVTHFAVLAPPLPRDARQDECGRLGSGGSGACRAVVAQVPARGRALCEVTYAQTLARRGRRRKFVYPVPAAEPGAVPTSFSARVLVNARAAPRRIGSTTHPMLLRRPAPHSASLTFATQRELDGRDLVVEYELPASTEETRARLSVYTPPDGRRDPYFLLTLPPPAALLRDRRALERPVDIVFCMDISGSTRGRKLNAIQEAVHDGLTDLSPRDRFGLVAYDDDARAFRRGLVPASPAAVSTAIRFVNRLRPSGGSDPERALRTALEIIGERSRASMRPGIIVTVLDDDDHAGLAARADEMGLGRRGIRVVALGARNDMRLVNYRLRGRELRRGPSVSLSRASVTFGPALTRSGVQFRDLNASYVYPVPERLPDLPMSTPVLLLGRLNQAPPARGTVVLTGDLEGRPRALEVPYVWEPLRSTSPVPALWAARRARRLQHLAARDRGDSAELTAAIERVQREHHLAAVPSS